MDEFPLGVGVDAATPVEIGSLTKIFTALLMAEEVRRDELGLSSRIDDVLFGERWSGSPAITAEELATHTSGLPRLGLPLWKLLAADPYRDAGQGDLLAYLQRKRPRSTPTREYAYSNLGYAVLGLMLEKRASRPYELLLEERLFNQLGLAKTHVQSAVGRNLASPGHRSNGQKAALWHWDAYAPCGGLVSTFGDLVLCARAFLDAGSPIAEVLELTTHPRVSRKGGGHVGLGWILPERDSFWHNGGTYGYSSYLGVDKKQNRAVIVLANQGLASEVTQLGTELMRLIRSATPFRSTE